MAAPESSTVEGFAPLVVTFESTESVDRDGVIVRRSWDVGDGSGTLMEDPDGSLTHTYSSPGVYVVTLTVVDDDNLSDSRPLEITVLPSVEERTLASPDPVDLRPVGSPIALAGTGSWDELQIREPGNVVFDPVTGTWICVYSGRDSIFGFSVIGSVLSGDGEHWSPSSDNPISGSTLGEDPYLAKHVDGTLYRDHLGRALMFAEEKVGAMHIGIDLWRSAANALTGWTRVGRVVSPGRASAAWDATDRTSPTVIHDGHQLVLLFEGRNLPSGQNGRVGLAFSDDDGETWTVRPQPVATPGGSARWNARSLVPDDLLKVGDMWVLLAHGQNDDGTWVTGRYATTDIPSRWTPASFTELPGNPLTVESDTVMSWGNDPNQALWVSGDLRRLERLTIVRRR